MGAAAAGQVQGRQAGGQAKDSFTGWAQVKQKHYAHK